MLRISIELKFEFYLFHSNEKQFNNIQISFSKALLIEIADNTKLVVYYNVRWCDTKHTQ